MWSKSIVLHQPFSKPLIENHGIGSKVTKLEKFFFECSIESFVFRIVFGSSRTTPPMVQIELLKNSFEVFVKFASVVSGVLWTSSVVFSSEDSRSRLLAGCTKKWSILRESARTRLSFSPFHRMGIVYEERWFDRLWCCLKSVSVCFSVNARYLPKIEDWFQWNALSTCKTDFVQCWNVDRLEKRFVRILIHEKWTTRDDVLLFWKGQAIWLFLRGELLWWEVFDFLLSNIVRRPYGGDISLESFILPFGRESVYDVSHLVQKTPINSTVPILSLLPNIFTPESVLKKSEYQWTNDENTYEMIENGTPWRTTKSPMGATVWCEYGNTDKNTQ